MYKFLRVSSSSSAESKVHIIDRSKYLSTSY